MDALEHARPRDDADAPSTPRLGLTAEIFGALAERLQARVDDVAIFTRMSRPFNEWCTWEAVSAIADRDASWTVQPAPPYAEAGVTGSRERADLLVFDPSRGEKVLMEIAILSDWSRNMWIDMLDGDTEKLLRPLSADIRPFQVMVATSLVSPIDVNPTWQRWLGMSKVWRREPAFRQVMSLGAVGQLALVGWELG